MLRLLQVDERNRIPYREKARVYLNQRGLPLRVSLNPNRPKIFHEL